MDELSSGRFCPVFQEICFRPGPYLVQEKPYSCSAEPSPLQFLLLERWVAERLQRWLAPENGYRGTVTLEVGSGGQITLLRETRRILATELVETGWQDVSFGSVRMTFQSGKPHILEEERTIRRPVYGRVLDPPNGRGDGA